MRNLIILVCFPLLNISQETHEIVTTDITNFWNAYDLLESAGTKDDSIQIVQEKYIDVSTDFFKEFIEARNFTAEEYVDKIRKYPKFWKSIRPLTENIEHRKQEIIGIFNQYKEALPDFEEPDVCFAIGCLRTGGTTSKNLILIGSEIAAANHEVDKSEMSGWLESVIGQSGDIVSMVAHETVHTQQIDRRLIKSSKNVLLEQSMKEGIADFLSITVCDLNINQQLFDYGKAHACELKQAFLRDLEKHPDDYSGWLYQGDKVKDRPANLGYFIGYEIADRYYQKATNKQKAMQELLNIGKYKKIYERSSYANEECE